MSQLSPPEDILFLSSNAFAASAACYRQGCNGVNEFFLHRRRSRLLTARNGMERPVFGACGEAGSFLAALRAASMRFLWRCEAVDVAELLLLQPEVALLSFDLVKGLKPGLDRCSHNDNLRNTNWLCEPKCRL